MLYSGGGADVNSSGPAGKGAAVIDLTAPTPAWQPVAPMGNARVYHTLTMLPDGRVLAVGGNTDTNQGDHACRTECRGQPRRSTPLF